MKFAPEISYRSHKLPAGLGLLAQKGNCEEESSPKVVGKTDMEHKKVTYGKKIFLMPFI